MGWKLNHREEGSLSVLELSENQCGMETMELLYFLSLTLRVEREPMWDGNCNAC